MKDLLAVLRQQDTENLARFARAKSGFAYTPRVQFMKNKVGFITRVAPPRRQFKCYDVIFRFA